MATENTSPEPYESPVKPFIAEGKEARESLHELVKQLITMVDSIQGEVRVRPPLREADLFGIQERLRILEGVRDRLTEAQQNLVEENDIDQWPDIVENALSDIADFLAEQNKNDQTKRFVESLQGALHSEADMARKQRYDIEDLPNKVDVFEVTPRMRRAEEVIKERLGDISSRIKGDIEQLLSESQALTGENERVQEEGQKGLEMYLQLFEEQLRLQKAIQEMESRVPEERMNALNLESIKQELLASKKYQELTREVKRATVKKMAAIDPDSPNADKQTKNEMALKLGELERIDSQAKEEAEEKLKEMIDALVGEYGVSSDELSAMREKLERVEDDLRDLERYLESLLDMNQSIGKAMETLEVADQKRPDQNEHQEEDQEEKSLTVDTDTMIQFLSLGDWSDVRTQLETILRLDPMDQSINQIAARFNVTDFDMRMFALINKYDQDESGDDAGDTSDEGADVTTDTPATVEPSTDESSTGDQTTSEEAPEAPEAPSSSEAADAASDTADTDTTDSSSDEESTEKPAEDTEKKDEAERKKKDKKDDEEKKDQ